MSLNGLDTIKVQEIFESTVAEAGGWFLLNYISRDEVEVYKSGTGGSLEFREIIGQYEEKSPLYGLLVYRRKRVLLKYVPEGTSRLLQARLTVHLQSVIERFPHDALLSLQAASDLTEAALSSSVSALKTSGSIRSLNSVKRRPLTEIVEDAGEILGSDSQISTPIDTPLSDSIDLVPSSATTDETFDSADKASNSTTKAVRDIGANDRSAVPRLSTAVDIADSEGRPSFAISESRRSIESQKSHLSPASSSGAFSYLYKPKVKLAPRLVDESRHSSPYVRPTSSLPAGIQLQSRQRAATSTVMQQPASVRVTNFSLSPIDRYTNGSTHLPLNNRSPTYDNRPVSRASAVTTSAFIQPSEEKNITPEKRRLMKALQKRKQQQKARQLAREGKFNDEDMADHDGERGHGDDAQSFVEPNSARSVSPVKVHQISLSAQNSDTDEVSTNNDRTAVTQISHQKEEVVPLIKDTALPHTVAKTDENLAGESLGATNETSALPNHHESSQHMPVQDMSRDTVLQHIEHTPQVQKESNNVLPGENTALDQEITQETEKNAEAHGQAEELEQPIKSKADSYQPLELNLPQEAISSTGEPMLRNEVISRPSQEHDVSSTAKIDQQDLTELQHNAGSQESKGFEQPDEDVHKDSNQEVAADHPTTNILAGRTLSNLDPVSEVTHEANQDAPNGISLSQPNDVAIPTTMNPERETDHNDPKKSTEHEVDSAHVDRVPISDHQPEQHDHTQPSILDGSLPVVATADEAQMPVQQELDDLQPHPPTVISIRDSVSHSQAASWTEEDSLLDEIHGATVQEATSIKLAKTPNVPASPAFAHQTETQGDNMELRESPSPTNDEMLPSSSTMQPILAESTTSSPSILASEDRQPSDPTLEEPSKIMGADTSSLSSRKGSRPNLSPANSFGFQAAGYRQEPLSPSSLENDRPASRKSAVSSLISQRIKAFEDKSSLPSSPHQTPTSAVKAQIVTLRKVSLNTPSSQQAQTNAQLERTMQSYPTPSPSPQNLVQKLGFGKSTKKESVPKSTTAKEKTTNDTISKLNEGVTDSLPNTSVLPERPVSPPESKGMRSLFSSKSRKKKSVSESSTPLLSKDSQSPTDAPVRGNSTPLSPSPETTERTLAPSSVESLASDGEKKEQKKRPGLLKRLSTMSSSTHRSIAETISVPAGDQTPVEQQETETAKKWKSTVTLGELNIQFPDTLLWKRKQVEIDTQGFVILAPSQAEKHSKAITKRYHISDFKMPYVPEPDREELPYSVNLDFLDGSTIQCACDSSAGQQRVYQALTTARSA